MDATASIASCEICWKLGVSLGSDHSHLAEVSDRSTCLLNRKEVATMLTIFEIDLIVMYQRESNVNSVNACRRSIQVKKF